MSVPTGVDLNDHEYERAIKAALRDDASWQAIVEYDPDRASEWVRNASKRVQSQMLQRNAEFESWAAAEYRPDYKAKRAELQRWKSSANHFRDMCDQRARQIKGSNHRDKQDSERRAFRNALLALAVAVEGHESGTLSDVDLYRMLDGIMVPHNGRLTWLRDVVAENRA